MPREVKNTILIGTLVPRWPRDIEEMLPRITNERPQLMNHHLQWMSAIDGLFSLWFYSVKQTGKQ
jgi:hypothetical protein